MGIVCWVLHFQHPLVLAGDAGQLKGIAPLDRLDHEFGDAAGSERLPHLLLHPVCQCLQKIPKSFGEAVFAGSQGLQQVPRTFEWSSVCKVLGFLPRDSKSSVKLML